MKNLLMLGGIAAWLVTGCAQSDSSPNGTTRNGYSPSPEEVATGKASSPSGGAAESSAEHGASATSTTPVNSSPGGGLGSTNAQSQSKSGTSNP